MQDTSGFYKLDNTQLLFGPNFVEAPTYALYRQNKNDYAYPIDGWYWFDSELEAKTFFGVEKSN